MEAAEAAEAALFHRAVEAVLPNRAAEAVVLRILVAAGVVVVYNALFPNAVFPDDLFPDGLCRDNNDLYRGNSGRGLCRGRANIYL